MKLQEYWYRLKMIFKKAIVVTWRFEGLHGWANASGEVSFLKNLHRHVYHCKAIISVSHSDREIEIIQCKWKLQKYCKTEFPPAWSCEQIAEDIIRFLSNEYGRHRSIAVEVLEDGENGAFITKDF